jgi:MFS family permease
MVCGVHLPVRICVELRFAFPARALIGIGFGGQWTAAAVMAGEASFPAHRGWWVGFMQSGWAIGWGIAELMSLAVLPVQVFWRGLFWAGGLLPLLLIPYVLLFVRESPAFEVTRNKLAATGRKVDSLEISSPAMLRTMFLACVISIGTMGGCYAIMLRLPAFLAERAPAIQLTGSYLAILIAGAFAGYLVSAWLGDLIGRRRNFVMFAIGAILAVSECIYGVRESMRRIERSPPRMKFRATSAKLFVDCGTNISPDRLNFLIAQNAVPGRHVIFSRRHGLHKPVVLVRA